MTVPVRLIFFDLLSFNLALIDGLHSAALDKLCRRLNWDLLLLLLHLRHGFDGGLGRVLNRGRFGWRQIDDFNAAVFGGVGLGFIFQLLLAVSG